jgi:hypothetical protein
MIFCSQRFFRLPGFFFGSVFPLGDESEFPGFGSGFCLVMTSGSVDELLIVISLFSHYMSLRLSRFPWRRLGQGRHQRDGRF